MRSLLLIGEKSRRSVADGMGQNDTIKPEIRARFMASGMLLNVVHLELGSFFLQL